MNAEKRYKRGTLRSVLLKTASEMISKEGLDKLTMRALCRRVGVSRTAPYRHFVSKTDLLCAIAEDGFKALKQRYQTINNDKTMNASARFQKIGMAYVEYAIENPGPYRLMFEHELRYQKKTPALLEAAKATFDEFLASVEAFRKEREISLDRTMPIANIAWVTVHGLSHLLIEDQFVIVNERRAVPSLLAGDELQGVSEVRQKMEFAEGILSDLMAMMLSH